MAIRSLKSLIPTADELLSMDLSGLGGRLLIHLKSYEGQSHAVWQHGGLNRDYLIATLEAKNIGLNLPSNAKPEYETRQAEVTRAVLEGWDWLVREGLLVRNHDQPVERYLISRQGETLLQRLSRYERYEQLGLDRLKVT